MLKLALFEDEKKLWEIPLLLKDWDGLTLSEEFRKLKDEMDRMELLFNTLSNTGRLKMMCRIFESKDSMAFTDLMNSLNMNPKIVSDSTKRLQKTGLIKKDGNGRYMPTSKGEAQFMMMSIALQRMIKMLDRLM